ncbi:unnamed protein product [Camellia sinensis]
MASLICISPQAKLENLHRPGQDQGDLYASSQLHHDRGKIVSQIKSEGDVLSKGESVVVIESDMDVETFYDSILAAIVVGEEKI